MYIETKYCYEYATRAEAVLRYEQYSYDNKLIFDSGTSWRHQNSALVGIKH